MDIDKKALGQRIKSVRKAKGLTLEEFGKLDKVVEQNTRLKESEKSLIDNNKNLSETIKDLKNKNIEKTITIEKQKEQFNKYQRRIRKTFSTKQKEKEINQNNYNKDR